MFTFPVASAGARMVMLTSVPLAIIPSCDIVMLICEATLLTVNVWVSFALVAYCSSPRYVATTIYVPFASFASGNVPTPFVMFTV